MVIIINKKIILFKENKKIEFFFLCVLIILVMCIKYINYIGKKINYEFYEISKIQATKLSKRIINESVNSIITKEIDTNCLFIIEKDKNNVIQSVDFNTKKSNEILAETNKLIIKYLKELENGKSSIVDINKTILTNNFISKKNGLFFEIPLGASTNNYLISNLGPKIPVKILINGDVLSRIETVVEDYGINSIMLKINIVVEISEQIILPKLSKESKISSTIPIAAKIIHGDIPNYYFNGQKYIDR